MKRIIYWIQSVIKENKSCHGFCITCPYYEECRADDFFAFVEERDYTLSYKMPFMLSFLKHMDVNGEADIADVMEDYIAFYQDRIKKGLIVDRKTCPYNEKTLKDKKFIKRNMLDNPFEKLQ